MDPRASPQHPFPGSVASPGMRQTLPPSTATTPFAVGSASQSPFAPPSHPYSDAQLSHQRRPSDPYYSQLGRPLGQEPTSHLSSAHSRHQSASSLGNTPGFGRLNMAPPSSPPQQQAGPGPNAQQLGAFPLPAPRAPPVSLGPPTAFPGGRELPALSSLPRTGSTGTGMSISSMLGGPPAARETAQPLHYPSTSSSALGQSSTFPPPLHASPRSHGAGADYAPYRRPLTPDHLRSYDARDTRGGPAGSPSGAYSTPESQRYEQSHLYGVRGPPMATNEQMRQQGRLSGGPLPPRPSSIPPPARPPDFGRPLSGDTYGRRDEMSRLEYNPERTHHQPIKYEDPRFSLDHERQERDRLDREQRERELDRWERDRRERAYASGDPGRMPHDAQHTGEYGPRSQQSPCHAEARDQTSWPRQQAYEPARRAYDPAHYPGPREYPAATTAAYGSQPTSAYAPSQVDRHPAPSMSGLPGAPTLSGPAAQAYGSPERARLIPQERQQYDRQSLAPQPRHRSIDDLPPPPSVAYGPPGAAPLYEPSRPRHTEELLPTPHQQRSFLGVQEINRRGRISPLPQAVQGAQPQVSGPAGEPGIKSEFGRMFSGIGSGVSGLGVSSPIPTGAQLPYSAATLVRREDPENYTQEAMGDTGARGRDSSRKRRKAKEEELRGDDESNGRLTPLGSAKRAKTGPHHHHHQYASKSHSSKVTVQVADRRSHHHHHHHTNGMERTASPLYTASFKAQRGPTSMPADQGLLPKDAMAMHHHGSSAMAKSASASAPQPIVIPRPKKIVKSTKILDSVKDRPRDHLGDFVYEAILSPARVRDSRTGKAPKYGWKSDPKPLPWNRIRDKENCTLTVKISKAHLTSSAREEITSRRALWGTDVYTDDSDVIAACIHGGWFRGEWPEDVDVSMLDLDRGPDVDGGDSGGRAKQAKRVPQDPNADPFVLDRPPETGPMHVPPGRDLQVKVLILPRLVKYSSMTRYGIKSREWGAGPPNSDVQNNTARHDGLSFMVLGIQWLTNGSQPSSQVRGKARRERINKALREIESVWGPSANGNNTKAPSLAVIRSGVASFGGTVLSTEGWFKPAVRPGSEGDKENQPAEVLPAELVAASALTPVPAAPEVLEKGSVTKAPTVTDAEVPENPAVAETTVGEAKDASAPEGSEVASAADAPAASDRPTTEAEAPIPAPDP